MRTLGSLPLSVAGETVVRGAEFAVTPDAETHLELPGRHHPVHPLDVPVAGPAVDFPVDVDAMGEVDELGNPVHPFPRDGAIAVVIVPHLLNRCVVDRLALVTEHAGLQ